MAGRRTILMVEDETSITEPLAEALEREGFDVSVIYHSHVDAGAYFSETDRRQALVGGQPAYPAAVYVVTSVMGGRVDAIAAFRWDAGRRDFVSVELPA